MGGVGDIAHHMTPSLGRQRVCVYTDSVCVCLRVYVHTLMHIVPAETLMDVLAISLIRVSTDLHVKYLVSRAS